MSIAKDEYLPDGTLLFNPTKPHGTIYSDGASTARWVQNDVEFRGDRKPVNYVEPETVDLKTPKSKA